MHFGGHDDPEPVTRINVDVGVDAPLTDQSQVRRALQQRGMDLRPFADEDERFGIREPVRQFVGVVRVVVPNRNFVPSQFREAVECLERVEVVVKDRDLQRPPPLSFLSNQYGAMSLTVSRPKRWPITLGTSGSV